MVDCLLIMIAWPPWAVYQAITLGLATYAELAWSFMDNPDPFLLVLVCAWVDTVMVEKALLSVFRM
jgi:hypothetical protein